jgi:hypothetical protein
MALITPFLAILMFGSFETGKYFLDAHVVQKAVRDGARFASRQSFTGMPCGGTPTNEGNIKNVVRYGKLSPATGDEPRLAYWTDPATITVAVACDSTVAYTNKGLYTVVPGGARRVTVKATVPYVSLLGMRFGGAAINADSQSAVMGI